MKRGKPQEWTVQIQDHNGDWKDDLRLWFSLEQKYVGTFEEACKKLMTWGRRMSYIEGEEWKGNFLKMRLRSRSSVSLDE